MIGFSAQDNSPHAGGYRPDVVRAQSAYYNQAMAQLNAHDKLNQASGTQFLFVEAKLIAVEAQASKDSTDMLSSEITVLKAKSVYLRAQMAANDGEEGFLTKAKLMAVEAQISAREEALQKQQLLTEMKKQLADLKRELAEKKGVTEAEPQPRTVAALKEQLNDLLQKIEGRKKRRDEKIASLQEKVRQLLMEEREREEKFARMERILDDCQERTTTCSSFFAEEEDK